MFHFILLLFVIMNLQSAGLFSSSVTLSDTSVTVVRDESLFSVPLNRTVTLDIIVPPGYDKLDRLPVLYLNDGQDLPRLHLNEVLESLYRQKTIRPFVLVAVHAGDRIQEYGTAAQADYMHRGSKARLYTDFVLTELLPYIRKHYRITADPAQTAFAGFSLGGLSAFDLVWHHPGQFSKAGVFSGSFWWRKKGLDEGYTDADRIMHGLIRSGKRDKRLSFWFETGTLDETSDRDNDGVIDSIDDTLDLIAELERKGYRWGKDLRYVEVKGGHHNQETWSKVMPDFLTWAFGQK